MFEMSVSLTNFTTALTSKLESFANDSSRSNDAKLAAVLSFVDSVIKPGKIDKSATSFFNAAVGAVSQHLKGNVELQQSIQEGIEERRAKVVGSSKQSLPARLAKQIKPMQTVLESLKEEASKPSISASSDYSLKDAQDFFFTGLKEIEQKVAKLEGSEHEKASLHKELVSDLTKETAKTFGKDLSLELVADMKTKIIPAEIYTMQAQSKYKLPVLDDKNTESLVKEFNAGSRTLSVEDKNEVVELAQKILQGEKNSDLEYHSLSPEKKAYMEHLRQSAEAIGASTGALDGVLGSLMDKLPEMLMPAIIGAIAGYLMGGMEVVGAIGAAALSFVGSKAAAEPNEEVQKQLVKPPSFTKFDQTTSQAVAA